MDADQINSIIGVTESYQAPEALYKLMMDEETREETFLKFLEIETDVSYEWFQAYFEDEHADRKKKKQDFTPDSISRLLVRLTEGNEYYEPAAGNGGILIKKWDSDRKRGNPLLYNPRAFWYTAEEKSDRSLPFLLFNMSIRGMNGAVLHGDSLTREFKNVYFIRNDSDDFLAFSDIIKMEKSPELMQFLNIRKWV